MTTTARPPASRWKRWTKWLAVLLVVIVLGGLSVPSHGPQRSGYQMMSWFTMRNIAVLLTEYQADHGGKLPSRLSELVPDYIDGPEQFYFTSRYTTSIRPTDLSPTPALIDGFTPYGFGQLPSGKPYVFERPGMWTDGTVAYLILDQSNQALEDWRSYRVTIEAFQKLLSQNFVTVSAPSGK